MKGERKTSGGSALYADRELKEAVIEHNGVEYLFKYRKLTWSERTRVMSEAITLGDNNVGRFDIDKFQRGCLLRMIQEHPFEDDLSIALIKLDDEVGRKLTEQLVPASVTVISEEQADFRGGPSEAQPSD